jgi:hypothetical protein
VYYNCGHTAGGFRLQERGLYVHNEILETQILVSGEHASAVAVIGQVFMLVAGEF